MCKMFSKRVKTPAKHEKHTMSAMFAFVWQNVRKYFATILQIQNAK